MVVAVADGNPPCLFLWLFFCALLVVVTVPQLLGRQEAHDSTVKNKEMVVVDHLLMSVPFYVYEDLGLPQNITLDGKPFHLERMDPERPRRGRKTALVSKHADDILFARAALAHPMRTHNPEEAKLFVVPTPFNIIVESDRFGGRLCALGCCHHVKLMRHVDEVLGESKWFRRNQGADHIAVISHWKYWKIWEMEGFRATNIAKCNLIAFERRDDSATKRGPFVFPSYYVGRPCAPVTEKQHDFAMTATFLPNQPKFQDRENICEWVQNDTAYAMPHCGPGVQCPGLAQAKFGFHARGDSFGSNRLMDTLLSGTVPIFTRAEQYDVLPSWIDWGIISYFADVSNRTSFLESLEQIIADTDLYVVKQGNVQANRDLFDYNTLIPFDTYMHMLQCRLWPELRRENLRTQYNALILPSR